MPNLAGMEDIRQMITGQIHKIVGAGSKAIDLDLPAGDPGLFGPQSASWKVHGDFNSMMIGGLTALLLQMLHPAALAGVWDHSNFRADRLGRLRRTAQFIAATTYGSTAEAERLIARVRRIHDHVTGTTADGQPYAANDPALLTWVHAAETSSFMRAYLRYRDPSFSAADQDRYFAETATVAIKLGAGDVPLTRAGIEAYLLDMRPQLLADARSTDVARTLLSGEAPSLALAPFGSLVRHAAVDLLPDWAAAMHGLRVPSLRRPGVRIGAMAAGTVLRWALRDNSRSRAQRRVVATPHA